MYTPPHSPFIRSFEHKIPQYTSINWQKPQPEAKTQSFNQLPTPPLDDKLDPIATHATTKPRLSRVPIPISKARTFPTPTSHARGTSNPDSLPRATRTYTQAQYHFTISTLPLHQAKSEYINCTRGLPGRIHFLLHVRPRPPPPPPPPLPRLPPSYCSRSPAINYMERM
jgi:hypothetical protein